MLKDVKWIQKADRQAWLDEITPLVQQYCDDKKMKNLVGWNCIIEQEVWSKLKAKYRLTMKPKNLYELIRSQFEPCQKIAKAKLEKINPRVKEVLDSIIDPFMRKRVKADYEMLDKLGAIKRTSQLRIVVNSDGVMREMSTYETTIRLSGVSRQIKRYGCWKYATPTCADNAVMLFDCDVMSIQCYNLLISICLVDDYPIYAVAYQQLHLSAATSKLKWDVWSDSSIDQLMLDAFNASIVEAEEFVKTFSEMLKAANKHKQTILENIDI